MSSRGAGSYEFKRLSWMQIDECSARLARSTSDGSADNNDDDDDDDDSDNDNSNNNDNNDNDNNNNNNPPTHRWSSVLGELNILPFASHMVTA